MATKNIMIVGVGGQGTLLTSRILGGLAIEAGYDVKLSEVHGMAQRGGSVVTFVRYGENVYEPIVEEGQADIIIAFEKLEAMRYAHFLKKDGALVVNDWRIDPMPVVTGVAEYPENIIEKLSSEYNVYSVNATEEAKKLGNSRVFNLIVLGVAASWEERKGLDVFTEFANRFNEDYQIVLVGTNDNIDKQLPKNIISIHRTNNQKELAEIYSAADVFANPTREDNFPTVNIEALACGTPVVTFRTGGSPEIIDETCGSTVECNDIKAFEKEVKRVCEEKPYSKEACLKRAKLYDMEDKFREYVNLYEESKE